MPPPRQIEAYTHNHEIRWEHNSHRLESCSHLLSLLTRLCRAHSHSRNIMSIFSLFIRRKARLTLHMCSLVCSPLNSYTGRQVSLKERGMCAYPTDHYFEEFERHSNMACSVYLVIDGAVAASRCLAKSSRGSKRANSETAAAFAV